MSDTATAFATMSLDDEVPWRPLFAGRDDFYDDCGFTMVGEAGDYDIMLGNFIYFFQGGKKWPKSQWLGDGVVNNNLVVITHRDQRGRGMADNNFSRSGMNLHNFYDYDDLEITRTEDSVTWKLGEMEYICRPPEWQMRGRSGEVEYDFHFKQLDANVVWPYGTRESARNTGVGGGYAYIECEGTLTVAGKTYPIKGGRGVHERLVFSQTMDFAANAAHDPDGFGNAFALHIANGDVWVWGLGVRDEPMFYLTVEGKEITYLPGQAGVTVEYRPLEPWHDPRSSLYLPSRWRVDLASPEGKLELDEHALGRAYYPWELKHGYQVMYWHLCEANGRFITPAGREIPIRKQLAQHEIVKFLMAHRETMNGPDRTPSF